MTDTPYLVSGDVRESHYMEKPVVKNRSHIVMATSENEARDKFEAYYSSKSVDYDVTYWTENVKVHDTIF